jgi:alpha-L-fucosidase
MRSPHGKDIVGELADACHARDFPLGLYYSVVDWHHPSYPNQGRHHELAGPEPGDEPDWEQYMEYLRAQVRELCTNYGEVSHFFWDMNVPKHVDPTVNGMLRSLQPNMVINDRGFDDGDFGTPEREDNNNEVDRVRCFNRPTEACNSVGTQSWGYREDEDYYTTQFLIESIDSMMAKGAHYLLNVGPRPDGRIPDPARAILAQIGDWYGRTREAFSDSQPCSKLTTNKDVLLTHRKNVIYVHLSTPLKSDAVVLPPFRQEPAKAVLLNNGNELETSTEVLPVYWLENDKILKIKGLQQLSLNGKETLVVKLVFGHDDSENELDPGAFEG